MSHPLWKDETGLVISSELVLVATVVLITLIVGLHSITKSIATELNDLSNGFGTVNQSYATDGALKADHAAVAPAAFADRQDDCDCMPISQPAPVAKIDGSSGVPESTRPGEPEGETDD